MPIIDESTTSSHSNRGKIWRWFSRLWTGVSIAIGLSASFLGSMCSGAFGLNHFVAICTPVSRLLGRDVATISFAFVSVGIGLLLPLLCVTFARLRFRYEQQRQKGEEEQPLQGHLKEGNQNTTDINDVSRFTLYAQQWLCSWGDRMWQFAVPLILMDVFIDTLFPGALFTMIIYTTSILAAPTVGSVIDRTDRWEAVLFAIVVENIALIASCGLLVALACAPDARNNDSDHAPQWSPRLFVTFAAVIVLGSITQPFNNLSRIAIQRDWIVAITEDGDGEELSCLNTNLRRIDLLCKILSPVAFGFAVQQAGGGGLSPSDERYDKVVTGSLVVGIWNLLAFPLEVLFLRDVYDLHSALANKMHRHRDGTIHKHRHGSRQHQHRKTGDRLGPMIVSNEDYLVTLPPSHSTGYNVAPGDEGGRLTEYAQALCSFVSHPIFPASFAYCMLYMTVLDMGDLMTSYLKWRGVPESILGVFRGVGACFGMLGTFLYPFLLAFGQQIHSGDADALVPIKRAGLVAIWLFALILTPCAFAFLWSGRASDYVLLGCTALARVGLWGFDLAETQILQVTVDDMDRGRISSMQAATHQTFFVVIQIAGMVFHDPRQFAWLVVYSVITVISAAVIFTLWSQNKVQRVFSVCA